MSYDTARPRCECSQLCGAKTNEKQAWGSSESLGARRFEKTDASRSTRREYTRYNKIPTISERGMVVIIAARTILIGTGGIPWFLAFFKSRVFTFPWRPGKGCSTLVALTRPIVSDCAELECL